MARRSRASKKQSKTRVATANSTRPSRVRFAQLPRASVKSLEDRRRYRPERVRLVVSQKAAFPLQERAFVTRSKKTNRYDALAARSVLGFKRPEGVAICVRRRERREVLHANGVAGGRVARPRWTSESKISCRRRK